MNKKTRNLIIIGAVVVVVAIIVVAGIFLGQDILDKGKLVKEVETIAKLDITKDKFDTEIKTSGNYGKVESAIKEYFNEYADNLQTSMNAISEEKLQGIMSDSNFQGEDKKFEKVLQDIKETREAFNGGMDKLIAQMEETNIMAKIEEKGVSKKYQDLYRELMFDKNIMDQVKEQQEQLKKSKDDLNKILDLNEKVYQLLAANSGKWSFQNGKLRFSDEGVYNQYNDIMKEADSLN